MNYHYVPLTFAIPRWLDDLLMWPSYWVYLATGHAFSTTAVLVALFSLVGLLLLVGLLRDVVQCPSIGDPCAHSWGQVLRERTPKKRSLNDS